MKLEVGKFYRTTDGRKVEIIKIYEGYPRGVVGIVSYHSWFDGGLRLRALFYTQEGRFDADSEQRSPMDLIKEWDEPLPPPRRKGWICLSDGSHEGIVKMIAEGKTPQDLEMEDDWVRAPWLDEPRES
jgi:hypothetical protein